MTIQLSDAQVAILTPAFSRPDRCIYPVTAPLKGGAVGNVAKSLLKRGLLEEVTAGDNGVVWRCGEDGTSLTLRASELAMQLAIGNVVHASEQQQAVVDLVLAVRRERGVAQEALLAILRRPGGGTIAELQAATGWLPHSVRGALSGTIAKKLGHKVTSVKENDRGRVYRVASEDNH